MLRFAEQVNAMLYDTIMNQKKNRIINNKYINVIKKYLMICDGMILIQQAESFRVVPNNAFCT